MDGMAMVSSRRLVAGTENGNLVKADVGKAVASLTIAQGLLIHKAVFRLISLKKTIFILISLDQYL